MNQALNFDSAAKFAHFNFWLGYLVAQKAQRPAWKDGDFFGQKCRSSKSKFDKSSVPGSCE